MTQGASMRSRRSAARKVSVRQRPWGALASSRWPRGERPWVRVMLVLAQVSSMKTRREGSSRPWYFFHCARRRATSGRSCSLACRLFFEADALVLEEVPDREVAHLNPTRGELSAERPQGNIRLLCDTGQKPGALPRRRKRPPASHLVGRRAPGRAETLRPFHDAGNADLERRRHRPAALTRRNCRNYPLTQIKRICSGHRMLASSPASILNHIRAR